MADQEEKEKPLEKMTAIELRETAKETHQIKGVHGMNKAELVSAIKGARGIVEEKKKSDASVSDLKLKIRSLKADRDAALEAKDRKKASICRRRISRLKKKTRKAAYSGKQ